MTERQERCGLQVASELVDFIENDALDGLEITADQFWAGLSDLAHELGPKNADLLAKRESL